MSANSADDILKREFITKSGNRQRELLEIFLGSDVYIGEMFMADKTQLTGYALRAYMHKGDKVSPFHFATVSVLHNERTTALKLLKNKLGELTLLAELVLGFDTPSITVHLDSEPEVRVHLQQSPDLLRLHNTTLLGDFFIGHVHTKDFDALLNMMEIDQTPFDLAYPHSIDINN
jgi:hypothetical protein